jgi:hypothetical protein
MLTTVNQLAISQIFTVCRDYTSVIMSVELARLNNDYCPVVISLWDETASNDLGPGGGAITAASATWQNFQEVWFLTPSYSFGANYTLAIEIGCGTMASGVYDAVYVDAVSVGFF